ncbi:MAG: acylphosphatase [Planctomycetes bacterium]|nr:acylphosphatase [Planctomycetota bacterium]
MEVGDDGLVRKEIHFRGRVQGVGFRQTTSDIASRFDVAGTVENLPDGQVLLVVEGRAAEVRAFVAAIESEMGRFISGADVQESPPSGKFADFRIRY